MTQSQYRPGPDANGLFGSFGGRYVAETLMPLVLDLAREYEAAKADPKFLEELAYFQRDYIGRPNPLYFAERLTEHCGGAKIFFKREELNHTGDGMCKHSPCPLRTTPGARQRRECRSAL